MNERTMEAIRLSWLSEHKNKAEAAWKQLPWPGRKNPQWKNSPVSLFEAETFTTEQDWEEHAWDTVDTASDPRATASRAIDDDSYAAVLRLVDGKPDFDKQTIESRGIELSFGAAPEWGARFIEASDLSDKLHARLFAEAAPVMSLSIASDVNLAGPILLDWVDGRHNFYAAPLIFLKIGEAAQLRLTLCWRNPDGRKTRLFLSPALFVDLGRNARLDLFELEHLSHRDRFLDYPVAILEEKAELRWSRGIFGVGVSKSTILARLEGRASRFDFAAAYASPDKSHVDISVTQRHIAPFTWSRSRLDAVADGSGKAISHGLIEVKESAIGTDAYLSTKTLALSPHAKAVSLPELAIKTNDLTASHGSTVGTISPDELFYLASRGIAPCEAKTLIAEGVLGLILERTPPELTDILESLIEDALKNESEVAHD
ncbi:SufD family Fe-S cluster assembly protein [Sediminispirochaeta bajacaliforniensis]|uniref:SufD family Fe-S cluster assembly protein n=1 Tax=Sediminispirochaeta bajacaliforniensis TaxID=148 RepID=UPI00035EAA60|nr:SufD family Fe-S cluster assembly protein [Sediminispirochaeta bajacaliforniensis]